MFGGYQCSFFIYLLKTYLNFKNQGFFQNDVGRGYNLREQVLVTLFYVVSSLGFIGTSNGAL